MRVDPYSLSPGFCLSLIICVGGCSSLIVVALNVECQVYRCKEHFLHIFVHVLARAFVSQKLECWRTKLAYEINE